MTFLGWLSDLLERLSDLQLGDEKVTLNHLVMLIWYWLPQNNISKLPNHSNDITCLSGLFETPPFIRPDFPGVQEPKCQPSM